MTDEQTTVTRKLRAAVYVLQEAALGNLEAPENIVSACDKVLEHARAALGDEWQPVLAGIWHSVRDWSGGGG